MQAGSSTRNSRHAPRVKPKLLSTTPVYPLRCISHRPIKDMCLRVCVSDIRRKAQTIADPLSLQGKNAFRVVQGIPATPLRIMGSSTLVCHNDV